MDVEAKRKKKREYMAEWRKSNYEKHLAINKKSREKNLEKIQEKARENYHATKHLRPKLTEHERERKSLTNRAHRLRSEYGLSVEDYERMYKDQDGLCAICGKPDQRYKNLAVDHCHTTGEVRGLLCRLCNTGIGALGDDVAGLLKALKYLEKYEHRDGV